MLSKLMANGLHAAVFRDNIQLCVLYFVVTFALLRHVILD